MTKLSDTQSIILSAAAERPDGNVLPLPGSLRGGAAAKVVGALLSRGLIREEVSDSLAKADAVLSTLCRQQEGGCGVLLRITPAGRAALGIEPDGGEDAAGEAVPGAIGGVAAGTGSEPATGPHSAPVRKTRDGTKQARLIAMLRRPERTTIAQIVEATGWQPHTVRGAFAGALKKRLGLRVSSEKVVGRGRVYYIDA